MCMTDAVDDAILAFSEGKPVMVFDSDFREKETDLLWPATAATPAVMRRLRIDCGGLLFLAIGDEIGQMFDLPWLQDLHTHRQLVNDNPVLSHLITNDLQYDTRRHLLSYYEKLVPNPQILLMCETFFAKIVKAST